MHQRLTNKTTFIRFVANDMHVSDFKRLNDWVERSVYWIENGVQEIYFFIHTPQKNVCPELANYFIEHFNEKSAVKLKPIGIQQKSKQGVLF